MTPLDVAAAAIQLGSRFGGSVTSWGRSVHRNRVVGGHPKSYHLSWQAFDLVYDEEPPEVATLATYAARLGLRLVREGDHDHFQPM